jgi:hypothetical protein
LYTNDCLFSVVGFFNFWTINQFHEGHWSIIALTETHFQNTGVTTVALFIAGADFSEKLDDCITIAQTGKRQAFVCQRRLFTQRDQRLDNTTQLFRLRQSGFDGFVSQKRNSHVAKHSQTVTAGAI